MSAARESKNPISGKKGGRRIKGLIFLLLLFNALTLLLIWSYYSCVTDGGSHVSRFLQWYSNAMERGLCSPSRELFDFILHQWRIFLAVNVSAVLIFLLSSRKAGNFAGVTQGSAHWATRKEKKVFKEKGENMPLADGVYLTPKANAANKNVFVLASPGGGKTFNVIIPAIEAQTRAGGSFFCTDTKGALYRDTAKMVRERGYRVYLLNLSDPWFSHRYNPLWGIHKERRVTEIAKLALSYTKNVRDEEAGIGDSVWEETFKQLMTAVWLYQYDFEKNPITNEPESRAMWRTAELIKDLRAGKNGIDSDCELSRIVEAIRAKDPLHPTVAGFDFVASGAAETIASVIITAGSKLQIFSYPEIEAMTRDNDIPIDAIFAQKTAVYLNFEVGSPYKAIAALFIEQLFAAAYYIAETKHGGTLEKPFKIYLDEQPNLCRIHSLPERLSTSRSYNIDILVSVQSMQQLKRMFKDAEKTLMNNCVVHVYLGSGEAEALKEISEALGKTTTEEISHSHSRGLTGNGGSNSDSDRAQGRELALPSELYSMPGRYAIVKIQNHPPIFAKKFRTKRQGFYKLLGGQGNPKNNCVITDDFKKLSLLCKSEYMVEYRERTERAKKERGR